MTATSVKLARTAEMTGAPEMASATNMRTTEARPTAVESTAATNMTAAEMRATAAATAHVNAATVSTTASARARVGCDGQSCQEGRRYDHDFEKASHGFTPRI
jgi:hypothetical protein